jgi:D-alanyl-D-alanine carboxypeptidase-like protein
VDGTISLIEATTLSRMTSSWRSRCPVAIADLRLLTLNHWSFDNRVHQGEIIVHRDVAPAVLGVFSKLFVARFPIERMRLVDEYGADDERSMEANNTSGFNCRRSTGSPNEWSEHSYGRAVDINPIQNPYVEATGRVLPPAGAAFTDRSKPAPGKILSDDNVVRAFTSIGWTWGGSYKRAKDYQHFSASGR